MQAIKEQETEIEGEFKTKGEVALTEKEQRRKEFGEITFAQTEDGGAVLQPKTGAQLREYSVMLANSGLAINPIFRGDPAACMALIMRCQPYRLDPIAISWHAYKASKGSDAPLSFESKVVNAMINRSAPVRGRLRYEYFGEGEEMQCTVTGIERETSDKLSYTSPPISTIHPKNSPLWKSDPRLQLAYYSSRAWARMYFPELMLGVYARDEMMEMERSAGRSVRDVTPVEGGFARAALTARGEELPEEEESDGGFMGIRDDELRDTVSLGEVELEEGQLMTGTDLLKETGDDDGDDDTTS